MSCTGVSGTVYLLLMSLKARKRIIVTTISVISIIAVCKILREALWVIRDEVMVDAQLEVKLAYDQHILAFLDPSIDKRIMIINHQTGATLDTVIVSHEWDLLFYIDTCSGERLLRIVDWVYGETTYYYSTLQKHDKQKCPVEDNRYRKPDIAYTFNGFSRNYIPPEDIYF